MLSPNFRKLVYLIFSTLLFGLTSLFTTDAEEDAAPVELEKIVVTPGRFTIYDGTSARISLSQKEIERFPLIDNDVMRAGHVFPGVVSSDYSARFSVRGGEKDDISVRLDGMELYNPYHLQDFGGAVSLIGLELVQNTQLLIGGFPAEYGEKMSGVFDLKTRSPNTEQFSANFGIDLINATATLEGPLSEKGSWLLSARRGYIDLILALMDVDEDYKPQYADVYGKFTYQVTQADTVTLNGLYGWDKNRIRLDDVDNNLDSQYDNSTAWAKWRHAFADTHWTDFFVFAGISNQNRMTGKADGDNRDFRFFGTKGELTANLFDKHTFRSGVKWQWLTAQYQYDVQERQAGVNVYKPILVDIDDNGGEFSAFLQDEWQLHSKLALNIGGHFVYQQYRKEGIQRYEIGPRVALAVKPINNLLLRGAWGIYHQPISLMRVPVEDGIETVGRAEQASHYIIGAEYTPTNNFLVRIEGYYNTFDNLVGRLREFGRQNQIFAAPESGDAKGLDVFMMHAVSNRLSWTLGYAYGIAEEIAGGTTIFRQYDRRHAFAVSTNYQFAPTWHLYLSWRFHTGEPRTPLIHTEVRLPNGGIACDRQFGETHSARMPAYHSLDFRITKQSSYRRWNLSWYFQILNLYNHRNLDQYAFSEVLNEETGAIECVIEEEPLFPIVPTLGVTLRF
ncbi:TonB-dependent receptor plug domain-containing protein [Candidatus Poribacteria bacterium]|nr:TonB-dependent receptor plug domain-containing protein [Candidatus Poribacteria bacterium]MYK21227.1 TonB-dependent receptor plug domain-containing protein [Candidatus Poribacteria bacterium]